MATMEAGDIALGFGAVLLLAAYAPGLFTIVGLNKLKLFNQTPTQVQPQTQSMQIVRIG